ncbi:hypothetical protein V6N13_142968 [Hibiscus sabdariffa]
MQFDSIGSNEDPNDLLAQMIGFFPNKFLFLCISLLPNKTQNPKSIKSVVDSLLFSRSKGLFPALFSVLHCLLQPSASGLVILH